jgi:hypothetical protein
MGTAFRAYLDRRGEFGELTFAVSGMPSPARMDQKRCHDEDIAEIAAKCHSQPSQ